MVKRISPWTAEMSDIVSRMSACGFNASEIAEVLNEKYKTSFSRCAILGKRYRIRNPDKVVEYNRNYNK